MRVANALGSLTLLFAASATALQGNVPSGFEVVVRRDNAPREAVEGGETFVSRDLEERGPKGGGGKGDAAEFIIEVGTAVVKQLIALGKEKATENEWVSRTLDQLAAKNPGKNILIFHNQKSKANLVGGVHTHFEVDLAFGRTKGYEIWVFDTGHFELAGDGGYLNVGYIGCWKGTNQNLNFCKR